MLKVLSALVSVDWVNENFETENLIVLNGTLEKITVKNEIVKSEINQIKGALFFDIKKQFSDGKAQFPNTILTDKEFEKQAQNLGINQDSCIVVYDEHGIYAAARVWWMFKLMGFDNIAVLNGGFPTWKKHRYPIEVKQENKLTKGNFKSNYRANLIKDYQQVLENINVENFLVLDARSKGRFLAKIQEPRKEVRGGRIPKSVSLPYSELLENTKLKKEELKSIFKNVNPRNIPLVFSCGSGITACVLALGAELSGQKNYAVYDGSWTEWGSKLELPIEK